jgi:DNA-binding response OmpR family regulator
VLLVDADPEARERLAHVLRSRGYEVVEAPDGAAGLIHLSSDAAVALIVVELVSGDDGSWIVNEQRASLSVASIPVLAFTASATQSGGCELFDLRLMSKADLIDELLKSREELTIDAESRRFH